ncbi:hypothetical protein [Rhodococcus sp. T7]|uniref:hypothetical protein n=1 Tax=Rhodococcus sp. T7 TaxID=627444 RepID=UPI0013594D8F|nr:hypothetical protein [Rhodococcus sp. T7]KAF0957449.1 hypothetical protein MLGJGCBP_09281 [Rhodococcus sp. T7]KAF0964272.1 hypothetical protein MLGJGCBP_02576 [Rhodococcus sp. T7]
MVTTRRAAAALAAAAAAASLIAGCGSDEESSATDSVTTTTPPDPTTPPADLEWDQFQSIWLPFAAEGPASNTGNGAVSGFTHSPQGAALAAIHQTVRMSVARDDQWAIVVHNGIAPGPERDAFAVNRSQISVTAAADPAEAPLLSGYVVDNYTDERADISIRTAFCDKSVSVTATTVVWTGQDWKLQLPAADDPTPRVYVYDPQTVDYHTSREVTLDAPDTACTGQEGTP